jgi:hypothetical protein
VEAREFGGEPHNNLRNHEILLECALKCDKESTLIFDSHYMDLAGTSSFLKYTVYILYYIEYYIIKIILFIFKVRFYSYFHRKEKTS